MSSATPVRAPEPGPEAAVAQAALNCYLTTVVAVAECLAGVCPEIGLPYQERLLRVPRRLGFHATAKALEESRLALVSNLQEFGEITGRYFAEMPAKTEEILALVSGASAVLTARRQGYRSAIDDLAESMAFAAELDDPARMRQMVSQQSIGLRASSEALETDAAALLARIDAEARELQRQIRQPDAFLTLDRLTGLLNRRGMTRQLEICFESPAPFCVLVFRWLPAAELPGEEADRLIGKLATRLVEQVRPNDVVGRWARSAFLVIFQCRLEDAEARSRQIARGMSDRYALASGEKVKVDVEVEIIEPRPLLSPDKLFERIGASD